MCTGCTKLKYFDYFDSANNNIDYIKEVQDQYIYPSDLSGIVAGCTSLTNFAFIMNGLGMHNIISDMSLAFNGCSKLTAITFPSRTEKNLGIKKNLTLIGGLTETDWINQLAGEVPTWLYDFTSNQIPPIAEQNEGKLTLPAAAENWEVVSPGSNFEANMIALGWDVVIPESAKV